VNIESEKPFVYFLLRLRAFVDATAGLMRTVATFWPFFDCMNGERHDVLTRYKSYSDFEPVTRWRDGSGRGGLCLAGKSPIWCPALFEKIFHFSLDPNQLYNLAVPSP
jgi:hypothetical protein